MLTNELLDLHYKIIGETELQLQKKSYVADELYFKLCREEPIYLNQVEILKLLMKRADVKYSDVFS